jgi:hypothetical protein
MRWVHAGQLLFGADPGVQFGDVHLRWVLEQR